MHTKEEAFKKITNLVQRFDEQKEYYKNKDYNETQTRRDFIDPFWKALGWDIDNENGYAETYREVIHEDRLKIGSATKAPDYSFKLVGGKRLFFLEAKKPSVIIKDEIAPAYQIRRYGWSAKMPISVISDFEEFAIYDCTTKPKETDKASNGRIKYLTYKDYLNEFDFIWDTFSKERVLKGSFDKYISTDKNKKGTSTVDYEFLQSLDKWRVELAINIALRNKNIYEDELNFIVQHTIDRIIFLRIAEDRSVEPYGELQNAIKSGNFYQNLLHNFHIADQKYNSGLFDFRKDKISNKISIDNKVIKNIISELYYPICPYEFSVLSVEILGSAYEQFLGKQISLSKYGKAIIEEKPEVRKAGGVYYTPQYIVDYIVKNTVGKLIENKTPEEISEIKIADPACGSGSFLIGAYQYLLDWHKNYYSKNSKPSKGIKDNPLTPLGDLTTIEKKRILLNNIYGVDLDSNAVEVTKLSLLLKCMEGETKETIEAQTKLFHDRVLPTLDNNIKSGNSLIDVDYYDNELDFGEEKKVKPFSWQKEFPEVFDRKNNEQDEKSIYHITCVMHNSRVSQRMIEYKVKRGKPEYLNINEEESLLEILCKIIEENNLTVIEMNLCADHLHFILVCNSNELTKIVGKIKSMSSRAFNILRGITSGHAHLQEKQHAHLQEKQHAPLQEEQHANSTSGHANSTSGHAHLLKADISLPTRGETQNSLWAQKFNRKLIDSNEQLNNTIMYIRNNRIKHNLSPLSKQIQNRIQQVITNTEKALEQKNIYAGFDCIIGNPPYVNVENLSPETKSYLFEKYKTCKGRTDIYVAFIEKSNSLVKENGMISFIIPYAFTNQKYGEEARKMLINNYFINEIIDTSNYYVFEQAVVKNIILSYQNRKPKSKTEIKIVKSENEFINKSFEVIEVNQKDFLKQKDSRFDTNLNTNSSSLKEKILKKTIPLSDICLIAYGARLNHKTEKIGKENYISKEQRKGYKPFLEGKNIERYHFSQFGWLNYHPTEHYNSMFPELFENEKLVFIRIISDRLRFAYDNNGFYNSHTVINGVRLDKLKNANHISAKKAVANSDIELSKQFHYFYLLGILNSNLINWYFKKYLSDNLNFYPNDAKQLPIKVIGKDNQQSVTEIIKYVDLLLQLNKEKQNTSLPDTLQIINRKIDYSENKINQLVYQLYELTEDEIKIIESN
ncbi:MAG: Eco57I restriction-modification methylase domain-containing protein [Chitinophagales bacterium]|nr:Eco57I restriction-modification methylase domain-containing protein [Chitinophagales bacterium]